MTMFTEKDESYTVIETAKKLNVTSQTVRTMLKDGRLKGETVNGKLYVFKESLDQYINEGENQ